GRRMAEYALSSLVRPVIGGAVDNIIDTSGPTTKNPPESEHPAGLPGAPPIRRVANCDSPGLNPSQNATQSHFATPLHAQNPPESQIATDRNVRTKPESKTQRYGLPESQFATPL